MNELLNFNYKGHRVRTVVKDAQIWWVLKDVADALDIKNARDITARLRDKYKCVEEIYVQNKVVPVTIVNESGLYKVIFLSRKPEAEAFQDWVTDEVLPQIKRTGMYIGPGGRVSSSFMFQVAAQMAELEKRTEEQKLLIESQAAAIEEMQPKVTYYEHVLNSPTLVKTKVIASDYGMTARAFNQLLSEHGLQYKEGKTWHLYSKYVGKGYARYKTMLHEPGNPDSGTSEWMYWTQTGRLAIYDLLKSKGIVPLIEQNQIVPD